MRADALALTALWQRRRALLWGVPAAFALAYLIALLVDYRSVIGSIDLDSDVVIAPVLAKLLGQAPSGSHVVLGNHPYYEEFLFLRATAGLPFYRQLWDVAPMLWTFLGFGILSWSVWSTFGGLPAVLVGSALLCLGHLGRFSFFAFDWHGLTVFHTILIGVAVVWLAPRAAAISWRALAALAVALGLLSALPVASDKLFLFWALTPLLVTCALLAWRTAGRARLALPVFAVTTVVVALLAGALVAHIMRSNGITAAPFPVTFVSHSRIVNNLKLLFEGYMALGGGSFVRASTSFLGYALLANGILILAALALSLNQVRRLAWAAEPRPRDGEPVRPRLAYIAFWISSLLIQSAAFVGTSVPVDTRSSRYVLAGYVAIAALIPLLALQGLGWRLLVTAGACVFALSNTYQLVHQPFAPDKTSPAAGDANRLVRFAQAEGVNYGYAGYWDAADLTWLTRFKLKVYPVQSGCGPAGLCAVPTHINTWYRPRPGTRSLLIADPTRFGVAAIAGGLGHPIAETRIGALEIAVYSFDLASKL